MGTLLANDTFIFWGAIVLLAGVPVVARYWAKVRTAEIDAALKREMIERGMSAAEIVQVLKASSDGLSRSGRRSKCGRPNHTGTRAESQMC